MIHRTIPPVLLVSALTIACLPIGCHRDPPTEDESESAATAPVPVKCDTARVTTLRPSIELVGTLVSIPEKTAVLSLQIPGQIQTVNVVEGQAVQAGEELLRLDDRLSDVQRARARAVLTESEAILTRLRNGARPEELDAARQELHRSEANLAFLRTKLESGQKLVESQNISQLELAQRQSEVDVAEANVATSRAQLKLLEVGPRPEEIAEAEAKVTAAQADLDGSELAFRLTRITAPIDGVVSDLLARRGMFASAGETLLTISDAQTLFARTRVPTASLAEVKVGGAVDVRASAFPDEVFAGTLTRIGQQADERTGDVDAFVSVVNSNGHLRPGLACRVLIWLPEVRDALTIPVAAIADRGGTPVVTVVRDEQAHEVEVRLGGRTNELVQVTDGLSAGDYVAVEGGYGLPDGCPCKVILEDSQSSAAQVSEENM